MTPFDVDTSPSDVRLSRKRTREMYEETPTELGTMNTLRRHRDSLSKTICKPCSIEDDVEAVSKTPKDDGNTNAASESSDSKDLLTKMAEEDLPVEDDRKIRKPTRPGRKTKTWSEIKTNYRSCTACLRKKNARTKVTSKRRRSHHEATSRL